MCATCGVHPATTPRGYRGRAQGALLQAPRARPSLHRMRPRWHTATPCQANPRGFRRRIPSPRRRRLQPHPGGARGAVRPRHAAVGLPQAGGWPVQLPVRVGRGRRAVAAVLDHRPAGAARDHAARQRARDPRYRRGRRAARTRGSAGAIEASAPVVPGAAPAGPAGIHRRAGRLFRLRDASATSNRAWRAPRRATPWARPTCS